MIFALIGAYKDQYDTIGNIFKVNLRILFRFSGYDVARRYSPFLLLEDGKIMENTVDVLIEWHKNVGQGNIGKFVDGDPF